MVHLDIRNLSSVKRLYRSKSLAALAEKICKGEDKTTDCEISLLFCDDSFIKELNHQYRGKNRATDVLSFQQNQPNNTGVCLLGDIVISLETVQKFCNNDRDVMRQEVRLLFCHGLLHLLGYTHDRIKDRTVMTAKQAAYLGIKVDQAWHS